MTDLVTRLSVPVIYNRLMLTHDYMLSLEGERYEGAEEIKRLRHERDQLYGYVNGLLGLLQLVRDRNDIPTEIAYIFKTNHRAVDAAAYLTQITPPTDQ